MARVEVARTVVADVANRVTVAVSLIGVGDGRAVVANIANTIAVGVFLAWVVVLGAVIHIPTDIVIIYVVIRIIGAYVANIANTIAVGIFLARIRHSGAVVIGASVGGIPRIAVTVAVCVGAFIAGIANTIGVSVFLTGIVVIGTVVEVVGHTIAVYVCVAEVDINHEIGIHTKEVVEQEPVPVIRPKCRTSQLATGEIIRNDGNIVILLIEHRIADVEIIGEHKVGE